MIWQPVADFLRDLDVERESPTDGEIEQAIRAMSHLDPPDGWEERAIDAAHADDDRGGYTDEAGIWHDLGGEGG